MNRVLASRRLTWVLVVLALGACGGPSVRGFMLQINRTYLDIREHIESGDLAALERDGAQLTELVALIRPFNEDAAYQAQADALAALGREVEQAGRARALDDARAVFLKLNRPCAECHRAYRVRATVD